MHDPAAQADELQRMVLLAELGVLDTAAEPGYDALTHVASTITGCPIALVTLVDGDRAWFKSSRGIALHQSPREWSFCSHAVLSHDVLVVTDARQDPRFADNAFVVGPPFVRFYAGEPLIVDRISVGSLCVIDTRPRELDAAALTALHDLATAAAQLLAQRRQRGASAEQQRRLADFTMMAADWLWETDAAQRLSWLSSGYAARHAMPELWRLGSPMDDVPVLDMAGQPLEPAVTLQALLERRQAFARAVVRTETDAGPSHLLLSAVQRLDDAGNWCGYRGTARDVNARVVAEQVRRDSAIELAEWSAQVPGLIFRFQLAPDGHMSFPYVSERVVDFDLSAAAVADDAMPALQLCHPVDMPRLLESMRVSARDLTTWRENFRIHLPHRGERLIDGHARPRRLADGTTVWNGLLTDVTEQQRERERLQALHEARQAAEKAAALRSELMSRVSHELRTPLNAILGFAQLLRLSGEPPPAGQTRHAAQQIESAGTHLLSLVTDMLDVASLDAGRLNVTRRAVDLAVLVRQSTHLLEPQARQHGVTLTIESPPTPLPSASADPRAVRQIVLNLVGNAIRFCPPSSRVQVGLQRAPDSDDALLLTVRDDGPGIAVERLPSLFEPFAQGDGFGRSGSGSGLGLSVSQRLAHAMGGHIEVDTAPGLGTTFTLRVPVDGTPVAGGDSAFDGVAGAPPVAALGTASVLYIEDDPVNALLMQGFFNALPESALRLAVATDARDGLRQAGLLRPDLVLLDMHLPDGDGYGVLKQLRADPRTAHIPVVALTADALPEQIERARRAGFDDYWTKPVDFRQLHDALHRRFPVGSANSPLAEAPSARRPST